MDGWVQIQPEKEFRSACRLNKAESHNGGVDGEVLTKIQRVLGIGSAKITNVLAERQVRKVIDARQPPGGSIECLVYFADDPINSYQVRQWYEPLRRLGEIYPVALMVRRPLTAKRLGSDCPVPVLLATNMPEQEQVLSSHPVRIIFYVNNNKENFLTLRYPGPIHIHLSHGESDKTSMTSNQLKAYDYAFIAGAASRTRILRALKRLDGDHLVEIGRPQLDVPRATKESFDDDRIVVLYAPTWEGERAAMSYGSLVSHGETMVTALLADPSIRLIFRPHPRIGVRDKQQAAASKRIKAAIRAANNMDPKAGHIVDDAADTGWSMDAAHIGIVDISAMAADWLATRKPMVVTKPAEAGVQPLGRDHRPPRDHQPAS